MTGWRGLYGTTVIALFAAAFALLVKQLLPTWPLLQIVGGLAIVGLFGTLLVKGVK